MDGVEILALFPNKTWQRALSDETGKAVLQLHTTNLPMTVYVAKPRHKGMLTNNWIPNQEDLLIDLQKKSSGGSVIFPNATGYIPGLEGRLEPILDASERTYLYADNIAIEDGLKQPVNFRLGKPLKLTDAFGTELSLTVLAIIGRSTLAEYNPLE